MGHVFADIELSNPRRADLEPVTVRSLADTGALMLCIPERIAARLCLEEESTRTVRLADGRVANVGYVGPIKVRFGARFCYVAQYRWKIWTSSSIPAGGRSRSIPPIRTGLTRASMQDVVAGCSRMPTSLPPRARRSRRTCPHAPG